MRDRKLRTTSIVNLISSLHVHFSYAHRTSLYNGFLCVTIFFMTYRISMVFNAEKSRLYTKHFISFCTRLLNLFTLNHHKKRLRDKHHWYFPSNRMQDFLQIRKGGILHCFYRRGEDISHFAFSAGRDEFINLYGSWARIIQLQFWLFGYIVWYRGEEMALPIESASDTLPQTLE